MILKKSKLTTTLRVGNIWWSIGESRRQRPKHSSALGPVWARVLSGTVELWLGGREMLGKTSRTCVLEEVPVLQLPGAADHGSLSTASLMLTRT